MNSGHPHPLQKDSGEPLTRPQFKTCLYARLTFNHAGSTLQDATGFQVPTDSRCLYYFNSGGSPKCRLPQWLGANCEANTNTISVVGL